MQVTGQTSAGQDHKPQPAGASAARFWVGSWSSDSSGESLQCGYQPAYALRRSPQGPETERHSPWVDVIDLLDWVRVKKNWSATRDLESQGIHERAEQFGL